MGVTGIRLLWFDKRSSSCFISCFFHSNAHKCRNYKTNHNDILQLIDRISLIYPMRGSNTLYVMGNPFLLAALSFAVSIIAWICGHSLVYECEKRCLYFSRLVFTYLMRIKTVRSVYSITKSHSFIVEMISTSVPPQPWLCFLWKEKDDTLVMISHTGNRPFEIICSQASCEGC